MEIDNNNDVLGYVITYSFRKKIRCGNLPVESNIDYIRTENGKYVNGLDIKISKVSLSECLDDARIIADKIVSLMEFESKEHVGAYYSGFSGIPKPGKTARVSKEFRFLYNIKTPESILNLRCKDLKRVLHLDQHQHYNFQLFNNAILHFRNGSIIEAFRELFSIIENEKEFPSRDKYAGLRNILSHSPREETENKSYNTATIKKFTDNFDSKDFDYLKFEPEKNVILIDINSSKTQEKVRSIVLDFIVEVRLYIQGKLGIGEST